MLKRFIILFLIIPLNLWSETYPVTFFGDNKNIYRVDGSLAQNDYNELYVATLQGDLQNKMNSILQDIANNNAYETNHLVITGIQFDDFNYPVAVHIFPNQGDEHNALKNFFANVEKNLLNAEGDCKYNDVTCQQESGYQGCSGLTCLCYNEDVFSCACGGDVRVSEGTPCPQAPVCNTNYSHLPIEYTTLEFLPWDEYSDICRYHDDYFHCSESANFMINGHNYNASYLSAVLYEKYLSLKPCPVGRSIDNVGDALTNSSDSEENQLSNSLNQMNMVATEYNPTDNTYNGSVLPDYVNNYETVVINSNEINHNFTIINPNPQDNNSNNDGGDDNNSNNNGGGDDFDDTGIINAINNAKNEIKDTITGVIGDKSDIDNIEAPQYDDNVTAPPEINIADKIQQFKENNNLFSNLHINLNDAQCNIPLNINMFGIHKTSNLDFCQFQSAFNTIGNVLISISYLAIILIVFI